MMGEINDAYLFWRVSEGGVMAPFNSAMPAWKGALSETQRWQVVNYLRIFAAQAHHTAPEPDETGGY
jgi:mono/diheme cytochrome c family protein